MNGAVIETLTSFLLNNKDNKLKAFNEKIFQTKTFVLGVSFPKLTKFSKELLHKFPYEEILDSLDFSVFEHQALYVLVLASLKEESVVLERLKKLFLHIDTWAITDMFSKLKMFNSDKYYPYTLELLRNKLPYVRRIGFVILQSNYLNSNYIDDILNNIKAMDYSDYIVKMMVAWFCSNLYLINEDKTFEFIKKLCDPLILRFTVRKLLDSRKVTDKEKVKAFYKEASSEHLS